MKKLLLALCFVATSALAVTSPDGTSIGPPATITDDKSAIFGIGPDGFVYRNGIKTTGHATAMAWSGGKVWAKSPTSPFNWYTWTNASPPWKNTGSAVSPVPPFAPSPDGTIVPNGSDVIIDASGARWTLGGRAGDADRLTMKNGVSYFNGQALALAYVGGKVYAKTKADTWYEATEAAWIPAPDPFAAHNAAAGITIDPIQVTPPTPDLSPSKSGQSI